MHKMRKFSFKASSGREKCLQMAQKRRQGQAEYPALVPASSVSLLGSGHLPGIRSATCWTMSSSRLPLGAAPVSTAADAAAAATSAAGAVEASGRRGQQPPELLLSSTMEPVLLSDPLDEGNLTVTLCFVRRQTQFFAAQQEDVDARFSKGGVKAEIRIGQIGIRCVHCARLAPKDRVNAAVSFPASISLIYQSVRNWQSE